MNPKDIMTDAIHNFHPQYQQYTQYSSGNIQIIQYFYLFSLPLFYPVFSLTFQNPSKLAQYSRIFYVKIIFDL